MDFCASKGYKHKEEVVFAKLHGQPLIMKYIPLPLTDINKYQIEELSQLGEMEMMLADKTKGIEFLVSWQELINKENYSADDVIANALSMMQNNYNLDTIIYVEIVNKKPVLRHSCGRCQLSDRQLADTLYRLKARNEISQMNRMLQQSAVTDLLTGLLNRQGFAKQVEDYETAVSKGKKQNVCATVLYMDLDNFKICNDTFGHAVGDVILIAFSRLFERVAGDKGYVVRYGGDEFLMILPDAALDVGIEAAEEIYREIAKADHFKKEIEQAIRESITISEQDRLSCSIGIASMPVYNREEMDIALKHADTKLYAVKKSEKSNYSVWTEND